MEINEYTQKLIDRLLQIGFVRKDEEEDKSKTNRHPYEIHLYYDDADIICIDCRKKYQYICAYPFMCYNYETNKIFFSDILVPNESFNTTNNPYSEENIDYIRKFKKIIKDSTYIITFKYDIKVNEKSANQLYELIKYLIDLYKNYKMNQITKNFIKKVNRNDN